MANLTEIPLPRLAICFAPALFVCYRLYQHASAGWGPLVALARMALQLSLVGYVLVFVFAMDSPWPVLAVLSVMLTAASMIALRPLQQRTRHHRIGMLLALIAGPGTMVVLVTSLVLPQKTWYAPSFVIPLSGMILSQSMNALSVAAERYEREITSGKDHSGAAGQALTAGTIGITNTLMAVGLVSLPGLMTGQILAGVSPLIAARYQIMIMCVLLGASGTAITTYLAWMRRVGAIATGLRIDSPAR